MHAVFLLPSVGCQYAARVNGSGLLFVFVPTNALFNTTLIQCQLLKHLKTTPTCFDHSFINDRNM
jgi:hypothetical protein